MSVIQKVLPSFIFFSFYSQEFHRFQALIHILNEISLDQFNTKTMVLQPGYAYSENIMLTNI